MKKLFLFALPILALGMTACGGGGGDPSSSEGNPSNPSGTSTTSIVSETSQAGGDSGTSSEVAGVVITVVEPDGFQANAKIAAWAWTGSGDGTLYDYDTTNLKFTLPTGTDHMKVLRLNLEGTYTPSTYPDAGDVYNNTADLEIQGTTLTIGWGSGFGAEMTASWN